MSDTKQISLDLAPGTILAGRYRIDQLLGAGGMGAVYRAYDTNLERDVAVKVLKEPKRLAKEATATAQLTHPNIVRILSSETENSQIPFLVLEYVQGRTLRAVVEEDGIMSPKQAKEITRQVLAALGQAHSQGIIHRDLKPHNIMLDQHGNVKVLDFGLAKLLGVEDQRLTQTGEIVGTPEYISPEQCTAAAITPQTDIYALGCCLYYMLSGQALFSGETVMETFLKHVHEDPDLSAVADPQLQTVIAKTTAKAPADRYLSAGEMSAALDSEKIAPAVPLRKKATKPLPPYLIPAISITLTCLLIFAGIKLYRPRSAPSTDCTTLIKEIGERVHEGSETPDDLDTLERIKPQVARLGKYNQIQYENAASMAAYRAQKFDLYFPHARRALELKVDPDVLDHFDYGSYNLLMTLLDQENHPQDAIDLALWAKSLTKLPPDKYAQWALRAADYDLLHLAKRRHRTQLFDEVEHRLAQGTRDSVEDKDLAILHVALANTAEKGEEIGKDCFRSPVLYYLESPHSYDYPGLRAHACVTQGLTCVKDEEMALATQYFKQAIKEAQTGLRQHKEVAFCQEAIADAERNLKNAPQAPVAEKPDTRLDLNKANAFSPIGYPLRHYHH